MTTRPKIDAVFSADVFPCGCWLLNGVLHTCPNARTVGHVLRLSAMASVPVRVTELVTRVN